MFNYALFLRTTERSVTVFGNKNQKFSYINQVYQFTLQQSMATQVTLSGKSCLHVAWEIAVYTQSEMWPS